MLIHQPRCSIQRNHLPIFFFFSTDHSYLFLLQEESKPVSPTPFSLPDPPIPSPVGPSPPPSKRYTRGTRPLIWQKNYITTAKSSPIIPSYSIINYISYDYISISYQAFIVGVSTEVEPISFEEAQLDPRWMQAMQTKITALEDNNT